MRRWLEGVARCKILMVLIGSRIAWQLALFRLGLAYHSGGHQLLPLAAEEDRLAIGWCMMDLGGVFF